MLLRLEGEDGVQCGNCIPIKSSKVPITRPWQASEVFSPKWTLSSSRGTPYHTWDDGRTNSLVNGSLEWTLGSSRRNSIPYLGWRKNQEFGQQQPGVDTGQQQGNSIRTWDDGRTKSLVNGSLGSAVICTAAKRDLGFHWLILHQQAPWLWSLTFSNMKKTREEKDYKTVHILSVINNILALHRFVYWPGIANWSIG